MDKATIVASDIVLRYLKAQTSSVEQETLDASVDELSQPFFSNDTPEIKSQTQPTGSRGEYL